MSQSSMHDIVPMYQRRTRQRLLILLGVLALLLLTFSVDVMTGPAWLSPGEVARALFHPQSVSRVQQTIVWSFRLPTALLAITVGMSLGVAGGQMQTILNNPLASPYTLGVSAAAGFGAALVLVCGAGPLGVTSTLAIPTGAFVSALICAAMLFGIGRIRGGSTETLIVGGVALHFLFSSGIGLLQYVATSDALQAIVFWTFGSLQGATWNQVGILTFVLLGTLAMMLPLVWQLTALQLGDEYALSLGVDVERLKLRMLLLVSLLTATAVCFTGSIGFVGLLAPHLARRLVGEDQRFFILLSAGCGGLLVSLAAILCKVMIPGVVFPIGMITAAIGAPCFAALAFAGRRFGR